jgi:pectate lyase
MGTGGNTSSCTTAPEPSALVGWASVPGNGVSVTKGGEGGPTTTVTTLGALNNLVSGTAPQIVQIRGTITGDVTIGSNKTLVGLCGAKIHGHISLNMSANVIVRNLFIVGNNCTDSPSDCSAGADAITVQQQAHHLWFDHDDVSDGSDGNLDMTHAADFITISWTKFHYSAKRTDPGGASGGHEFSNLIGSADTDTGDMGHLRVTFHHDWWADNVYERMPRARFGQIHVFNNLYTPTGNLYCVGAGVGVNIRAENNVFVGATRPFDTTSFSDANTVVQATGNIGAAAVNLRAPAFTPPYAYMLDDATTVQAAVTAGAGPD